MAALIYILCALTSLACAMLLLRRFGRARVGLLFWSGLGFLALAAANTVLFIDLILVPEFDLSLVRNGLTLGGVLLLLYGLVSTHPKP